MELPSGFLEATVGVVNYSFYVIDTHDFVHKSTSLVTVLYHWSLVLCWLQADLGSISSEIQSLQEQSLSMNVQLKNRQVWWSTHRVRECVGTRECVGA